MNNIEVSDDNKENGDELKKEKQNLMKIKNTLFIYQIRVYSNYLIVSTQEFRFFLQFSLMYI